MHLWTEPAPAIAPDASSPRSRFIQKECIRPADRLRTRDRLISVSQKTLVSG